jgi:hypothetical protein
MLNSLRSFRIAQVGSWRLSPRLNLIVDVTGVLLLVAAPFWLHELFGIYEENTSISFFAAASTVVLILVIDSVLILHVTRSHPSLRRLMATSMLAKVAAAGLYISTTVRLYHYAADMAHYVWNAEGYATTFQQTGALTIPDPLLGTNFISFLLQCLFVVTGISLPVAMIIFASLSFWGTYFIYRAFSISFPESKRFDLLATLIFLLPSCVFWTASIGKDAVVMLGLGVATLGFAKLHHRAGVPGYLFLAAGLAIVMTVRPHMAGIVAIAMIFPYLFGPNRTGLSGVAIKAFGIPALVTLTWFLVAKGATYAEIQDFSESRSTLVHLAASNAALGGSTYGGSLTARLALAPFLLIRPFPFEVYNFQAAFASLEGLGLLAMFWRRRKILYQSLRHIRSSPFAMFLVLYTVEFTIIYAAATTNFGLLNRQRVMLIPFTVMLFLGDSRSEQHLVSLPPHFLRSRRPMPMRGKRSPVTRDLIAKSSSANPVDF